MPKRDLEAHPVYNSDLLSIFRVICNIATRILRPICCQDMENASSQLLGVTDATNVNLFSDPKAFGSFTADEMRAFAKERRDIEHRLQLMTQLKEIPEPKRMPLDYTREAARIGCLIFANTVLLRNMPQPLSLLITLTSQAIDLVKSAERNNVVNLRLRSPPGSFIWLLCLGGILPLTDEQETWFAQKIVDVTGQCDMFRQFAESDPGSRGVCWDSNIKSSPVRSLWQRIDSIWKMNKDKVAEGEVNDLMICSLELNMRD